MSEECFDAWYCACERCRERRLQPKPTTDRDELVELRKIVAECSNPECYICEQITRAIDRIQADAATIAAMQEAGNGFLERVDNRLKKQDWVLSTDDRRALNRFRAALKGGDHG